MILHTILAQVASETEAAASQEIVPIDVIWQQITSLSLIEALTFVSFGTVCLLYGWRVFKVLVVICFALIGLFGGAVVSDKISGQNHQLLGAAVGLIVLAAIAIPLMKWSVSLLGAIAGGIITSGIWYACKLPEQYIWAGALIGFVAGGMVTFIGFKIAVMLFSSLGGSTLIVTGLLALIYLYPDTSDKINDMVHGEKWFLPTMIIVPTLIGMFFQNKFIKRSPEWSMPGDQVPE